MSALQWMPLASYALVAALILGVALRDDHIGRHDWLVPAVGTLFFVPFTGLTLAVDGITSFWTNHTSNLSGNQVWFDLIFATAVGFVLLAPRARAVGMRVLPWAAATVALACVALLPMLARVLWLEARRDG